MGHHLDGKSSIVPLIDRLNRYPIGLPDSDKLRRILAILFSEEEAYLASRFPLEEATLVELVRATGWAEDRLRNTLEVMADKGLVLDSSYGGKTFYLLMPGLIGFFELTFMKRRGDLPVAELAQLMEEYLYGDPEQRMGREFFGSKTPLTRSLAYEEHIPVSSQVATYESARELIRVAGYGAVGMCYCRHKKEHLQQSCEKKAPTEGICISLGNAARFMVRRGFAEYRNTDQLLAVLATARDLRLTHITDNIRHKPSFICNCCSCCCELLGGVLRGFPLGIAKANFTVTVDTDSCLGCGLCVRACNAAALELVNRPDDGKKQQAVVKADHCLGCGACISACPSGSLALLPVARPLPPEKKRDLFKQILKEKGRLTPFVVSGVKKRLSRAFRKE
ncbi:MAG: 4Fe-4S dicluster domain-containing protein [Desulforhopalus sp.]|jgi:ferredoxin|nr:4Fe-4S dicluster domain-containing protein [Desulforhopalus sp.]